MHADFLALLTVAVLVHGQSQSTQYTATGTSAVDAARATAKTLSPTSNVKGKAFDRLAIIWLENTDYDLAIGDPNLAWLAKKGIALSNHFAVTHPSEPNYVASIGGDYFGMNNDDFNFVDGNVSTIIDLLEAQEISWSEYLEDLPYSGFEGEAWVNQKNGRNDYVRKHNPAIIYNSVSRETDRLAKIKNLTMFHHDLENHSLPQWMYIVPNMTSDAHDSSITVAGEWTRRFLEPLLDDARFMNNTLVLVTFDENGSYAQQNRILALLLGDAVPPHQVGTEDDGFYNHYSEIASVQANWGLHTLGRWDVGANVWGLVGAKTGDKLRKWSSEGAVPIEQMYWNQSYGGVFNNKGSGFVYPSPNLCIERCGRTVAPVVVEQWRGSGHPTYYKDTIEVPDGLHPPTSN